ncbi:CYTH domain-containing protein [Halomonas sp. PAMB 3232]|uniref:CYTH domain-containing protein n=1 Tax=Halomonas sp. PAMB 3232 TaxID=3075221 RepID=UPI002898DA2E|nr:CYTH domain-containing protein [Halomonas sp. PAMB 3232]WNL39717.1 CYTH domain-containing protein [Halomonas sp. PAMB 3232]
MKDHSPLEVELKLALPAASIDALLSYPALAKAPTRKRLTNTYYDTPNKDLSRQGIAVRLRQTGGQTLQTVKTKGHGGGGLSTRGEWEWAVSKGLDIKALAALPPFENVSIEALKALTPTLATDFDRRSWMIDWNDSRIELVLDEGEVRANGARAVICEIELELKEGAPDALWSLALSMSSFVPLRPSDSSKAARGNALSHGEWTLPQANTPSKWLHRATVAMDAYQDSREPAYFEHAVRAYETLAEHPALAEPLRPTAAALARALDKNATSISFGYNALSLAHRLTLESALS